LITSQGLEPNNNSYLIDKQLDANALFLCEHF
jgi:hypothetical protein